jgi:hypothetical protein
LSLTLGEDVLGSDGHSGGIRGQTGHCGTAGMHRGTLGATGASALSGTTRGNSVLFVKSGAKGSVSEAAPSTLGVTVKSCSVRGATGALELLLRSMAQGHSGHTTGQVTQ